MKRREFIIISSLSLLTGCVSTFRVARKSSIGSHGGPIEIESPLEYFNFYENNGDFRGVIHLGTIRALNAYYTAVEQGFKPRPGAIVSNALEEMKQFVHFLRIINTKVRVDKNKLDDYKSIICSDIKMSVNSVTACEWRSEFDLRLVEIIDISIAYNTQLKNVH